MNGWEKKARDLQFRLHVLAAEAGNEAERFRGTSNGFGPVREAQTWTRAARMADEAFGIHPLAVDTSQSTL